MQIAALATWVLTALGGFYLLATWIGRGGHRGPSSSRFPPAVIFGHFALAATGLIVWIVYVVADTGPLAWAAFVILLPVAVLGFVMLLRWMPTYRARSTSGDSAPGTGTPSGVPAEAAFPVVVVLGHGVLAVATLVLVLLTALEIGGS